MDRMDIEYARYWSIESIARYWVWNVQFLKSSGSFPLIGFSDLEATATDRGVWCKIDIECWILNIWRQHSEIDLKERQHSGPLDTGVGWEGGGGGFWKSIVNIARIVNAVQVTLWLLVNYLNRCLCSHCRHCSQCLLVSSSVYTCLLVSTSVY